MCCKCRMGEGTLSHGTAPLSLIWQNTRGHLCQGGWEEKMKIHESMPRISMEMPFYDQALIQMTQNRGIGPSGGSWSTIERGKVSMLWQRWSYLKQRHLGCHAHLCSVIRLHISCGKKYMNQVTIELHTHNTIPNFCMCIVIMSKLAVPKYKITHKTTYQHWAAFFIPYNSIASSYLNCGWAIWRKKIEYCYIQRDFCR